MRLGRRDRMGAPDTFDAAGYAALLTRLRGDEPVVYAPEFRREIEEPIAGAIAVPRDVPLVVTEGNYLLLWPDIPPLLDEIWYVETDEELRVQRLIQRHIQFGKTPEYARAWVHALRRAQRRSSWRATAAAGRRARAPLGFQLLQRVAAVDDDRLAGHVGRARRGQERDHLGDLVRRARAADRRVRARAQLLLGRGAGADPVRARRC